MIITEVHGGKFTCEHCGRSWVGSWHGPKNLMTCLVCKKPMFPQGGSMTAEMAKAAIDYCVEKDVNLKVILANGQFELVLPNELHADHVARELNQLSPEAVVQSNNRLS